MLPDGAASALAIGSLPAGCLAIAGIAALADKTEAARGAGKLVIPPVLLSSGPLIAGVTDTFSREPPPMRQAPVAF